jgi:hypothetical protein
MTQISNVHNNVLTPPNTDFEWDTKDCVEVAKRTGFCVGYVRQVVIYNTRNHDGIWMELARVVKQREEAQIEWENGNYNK